MVESSAVGKQVSTVIEQYKAYLQDMANIGSRHETARGFYLSVLSALLAFLALAGGDGPLNSISDRLFVVVGIGAMAICSLWLVHTLSFSALYSAKMGRLNKMEEALPFQNFAAEFDVLKQDWRYFRLTYVECWVAIIFNLALCRRNCFELMYTIEIDGML